MFIEPTQLVAHRGHQQSFPENSLLGIMSAIETGALFIEVDVQLNDEGMVYLMHDSHLQRLTGVDCYFHELSACDLAKLSASEPSRLGQTFSTNPIHLLVELLPIIRNYHSVNFFIELKKESISRYGSEACINALWNLFDGDVDNVVLISEGETAIQWAKRKGFTQTGLVSNEWSQREMAIERSAPDYLFVNYFCIPVEESITASVPVIVYETIDAGIAQSLLARGATAVETFAINDLLKPLSLMA